MAAIGLVVGDAAVLTTGDTALRALLEGDGHTVTLIADEDAVPGGMDCYVITESGTPGNLVDKYTAIEVPVVSMEVGGWDDLDMTTVNGTPQTPSGTTTDLLAHEITTGLADPLTIYTASIGRYGVDATALAAGAVVFAQHPSVATHKMGFCYDTDATMVGGGPAPARRVALPYIASAAAILTAGGGQLFLNAVTWALGGAAVPQDGDLVHVSSAATVRDLSAIPGAASRGLTPLVPPTVVRPLGASTGGVDMALTRVVVPVVVRELAAGVSERDITILSTTEPVSSWPGMATEPVAAWAATEAASAWAATEGSTAWQTTEPHL